MEFNYMEGLLLSDLLCLYRSLKDEKYLDEIKRRMFFCGFSIDEVMEFIRFENDIINSKDEKYDKSIISKYYILGKKDKTYIFVNPEEYMYNPESGNKKTLMISEILAIIDEAIFLSYSQKIKEYLAKEEILNMSLEEETNWLYFEFKNRIEYICRCANKVFDGPKAALYNEKNSNLYINEMQICLKRWNVDVSSRNFIPYTNQFFD